MTGLAQSHPELQRRHARLVELCWANGWETWIGSSTRSRATQEDLYRRWRAGLYKVPSVANPNADGGPSPWGWRWTGSYHMPQADGFSHALDLGWRGCDDAQFNVLAESCGLRRTVRDESWHYQWVQRRVIFDAPALVDVSLPPVINSGGKTKMHIWTCVQNDGQHVNYLWDGKAVRSMHGLEAQALSLAQTGTPNAGHMNEAQHATWLARLLENPDPGTGAQGWWTPESA